MSDKIYYCDRHVMEPLTMWAQYVDADTLAQYPITFKVDDEQSAAEQVKRLRPKGAVPLSPPHLIEEQLSSMDETGISQARIFSTFAGFIAYHSALTAKASLDYADGYNRFKRQCRVAIEVEELCYKTDSANDWCRQTDLNDDEITLLRHDNAKTFFGERVRRFPS